jgi:DNA-binding NtrC family response regulator
LLCEGDEIVDLGLPAHAPSRLDVAAGANGATDGAESVLTLKEAERRAIVAAMQAAGGDKTRAAKLLEISRTALYEKMKRFGLG